MPVKHGMEGVSVSRLQAALDTRRATVFALLTPFCPSAVFSNKGKQAEKDIVLIAFSFILSLLVQLKKARLYTDF